MDVRPLRAINLSPTNVEQRKRLPSPYAGRIDSGLTA